MNIISKASCILGTSFFVRCLPTIVPVSIIALIPGVYMSFKEGMPVVGIADLVAFSLVLLLIVNSRISIQTRKVVFLLVTYCLSVVLLYYLSKWGPGMLYLLFLTAITSIIYSSSAAYWSAFVNTLICIAVSLLINFETNPPVANGTTVGVWIAISSNLVALSIICAACLNHLIAGIEKAMYDKNTSEANLSAIIENSDANIYSLDRDLRYVTFNHILRDGVKRAYGIDIKPGDRVIDFLTESEPEEAQEWIDRYAEALSGKSLQFEKEFNANGYTSFIEFSIHPIIENNFVIGLSCFATDITTRKLADKERAKISKDLIQRNTDLQQFAYIVSHNLRAPTANIMGIGSVLKKNISQEQKEELLQHLFISVRKLDEVVSDLNKILVTRSDVTESKQTVLFPEIISDVTASMATLIDKEKVTIKIDFLAIDKMVTIKSYLYSIFYNLLSNSIKYKHPDRPVLIEICSKMQGNNIYIHFKDNGMGIDLKQHGDKVFGLYKRFHLNIEGKGVGLFMIKTQIEVLGGKISVQSEAGVGTEFIIEFEMEAVG
jgi:PAS domain S-box-containing protein